ncbi:S8 family serine peptidase [Promicromonospora thailandica]|uniref:Subtilase family protein n=1 Tax=Promicromonospora thailandica TaxID=765201 RepID=A0A9X2G5L9_9MICO|nr:S8 family serine peptidase [Promicromonospora thailandica]MCP2266123.1 Subtilase family protein [Promicromonospora thailandica]BFF20594.1 S8 family serine peptidase [Promicromonospora thailandica]
MRISHTRRAVAVATAATLALTALGGVAGNAADEPVSTPVPVVTPDGALFSYVVNTDRATARDTALAVKAITRADGVVVQTWPQIGVVVVHSANGSFREDVVAADRFGVVESVGVTRTVSPTEGTPGTDAPAGTQRGKAVVGQAKKDTVGGTVDGPSLSAAADDPGEVTQWDMQMIKADQAIDVNDGSSRVTVGVLDSGIEASHPDLAGQVDAKQSVNCTDGGRPDLSRTGWLPTTSDHGTHVAGTIAAARNGTGIVGVAPGVRLASVKVVNDDGFIYPEYAVCGFVWAGLRHMDVTNNSYYVDPFMYWCEDQPDQRAAKEAVRRAVEFSTRRGVVHAAAAGNAATDLANNTTDTSSPNDSTPIQRVINSGCEDIPAELDGVVTVSSLTQTTALSSFSNRGLDVIDVAAPGSSILSTELDGTWGLKSGTSMASPHVAGVLALLKSAHPRWSPARLEAAVRTQADDHECTTASGPACVGTPANNSYYGEGIADALEAVTP